MTATNEVDKTLGEQMPDLLRRKPKNFDVVFSVGPEKVKVEAVKFVLKAASPVFETEFEEKWENGVMRDGEGIPLPNFDPIAFQLFVNLLILDAWSLASLNASKLSPNNLLSLLGLCRHYEIMKAIKNLEMAADDFIQSVDKLKDTDEFLKISRENLETIFSFEKIPLDENEIFQSCCRWACNQCTVQGLEPTGENYRKLLGGCLFEVRFPAMSVEDFTKAASFKKNILTKDEKLAIYEYIGLDAEEKTSFDKTQLQFKAIPRVYNGSSRFLVLSLPEKCKLKTSLFTCDGTQRGSLFEVSKKIALNGIGFLGPMMEILNLTSLYRFRDMLMVTAHLTAGY